MRSGKVIGFTLPHLVFTGVTALAAGTAAAATVETLHGGRVTIRSGSTTVEDGRSFRGANVSATAQLTAPNGSFARGAARSNVAGEIAANVRLDGKSNFFPLLAIDETISVAQFNVNVGPDNAFVRRASLDFLLPPSFVEVTSNAEFPDRELEMTILATLSVCFSTTCSAIDQQFFFQTRLTASYNDYFAAITARGNPALDLSSLRNPVVTDTAANVPPGDIPFLRTVTVDFPEYSGHLDLGVIPMGSPLTVEYQMQARGEGDVAANIGLAAINDPFVLDTDPVLPGTAIMLATAPVPEPATALLWAAGVLTLIGLARRRTSDLRRSALT